MSSTVNVLLLHNGLQEPDIKGPVVPAKSSVVTDQRYLDSNGAVAAQWDPSGGTYTYGTSFKSGDDYAYDVIIFDAEVDYPIQFKAELQAFAHLGGTLVCTRAGVDTHSFTLGSGSIYEWDPNGTDFVPNLTALQSQQIPHPSSSWDAVPGGVLVIYDGFDTEAEMFDQRLSGAVSILTGSNPAQVTPDLSLLPFLQSQLPAGTKVELSPVPEFAFEGTITPLRTAQGQNRYDTVIHLNGNSYYARMPAQGREAIVQFMQNGGLVLSTAWSDYEAYDNDDSPGPTNPTFVDYDDDNAGSSAIRHFQLEVSTDAHGLADDAARNEILAGLGAIVDAARGAYEDGGQYDPSGIYLAYNALHADATDAAVLANLRENDGTTTGDAIMAIATRPLGSGRAFFIGVPYLYREDDSSASGSATVHFTYSTQLVNTLAANVANFAYRATTAGIGGDPYVTPIQGPTVKLPNCYGMYRLLQTPSIGLYINVEVGAANAAHRARILDCATRTGVDDSGLVPVSDGFFMHRLFISALPNQPGTTLDLRDALFDSSAYASASTSGLFQGRYVGRTLQLGPGVQLELRKYENPQIDTQVLLHMTRHVPADTDGLLYRNYRPKLFRLNSLVDTTPRTRHLSISRPLQCRSIVGRTENRDSVLHPRLFASLMARP